MPIRNFVNRVVTHWTLGQPEKTLGASGELKAAQYLKKKGLRIIERGYRNRIGEIDLIAVDQKSRPRSIVFIEVKTRRSLRKGRPVEAVTIGKQNRIIQTAMVYLKRNDLLECRVRFDVVGILWPSRKRPPQIEHFTSAFQPSGNGQMFR